MTVELLDRAAPAEKTYQGPVGYGAELPGFEPGDQTPLIIIGGVMQVKNLSDLHAGLSFHSGLLEVGDIQPSRVVERNHAVLTDRPVSVRSPVLEIPQPRATDDRTIKIGGPSQDAAYVEERRAMSVHSLKISKPIADAAEARRRNHGFRHRIASIGQTLLDKLLPSSVAKTFAQLPAEVRRSDTAQDSE